MDVRYKELILILKEFRYISGEIFLKYLPDTTQPTEEKIIKINIQKLILFQKVISRIFEDARSRLKTILDILKRDSRTPPPKIKHFLPRNVSAEETVTPEIARLEAWYAAHTKKLEPVNKHHLDDMDVKNSIFSLLAKVQKEAKKAEKAVINSMQRNIQIKREVAPIKPKKGYRTLLPKHKPPEPTVHCNSKRRAAIMRARYKVLKDFIEFIKKCIASLQEKIDECIQKLQQETKSYKGLEWATTRGEYLNLLQQIAASKPIQPVSTETTEENKPLEFERGSKTPSFFNEAQASDHTTPKECTPQEMSFTTLLCSDCCF